MNWVDYRLASAQHIWLFLDYDGTLANFAPTPDDIIPEPDLISLISEIAANPRFRVTVLSGRKLDHICKLVPVKNTFRAGTYGIELILPDGSRLDRLEYHRIRPILEGLKPVWMGVIALREEFYLEDKGWTLAIHAKYAADDIARQVLAQAKAATLVQLPANEFVLLEGEKFLEVKPELASKFESVEYLMKRYPFEDDALLVYLGDDKQDEIAFQAVHRRDGVNVLVNPRSSTSCADIHLNSPAQARSWLRSLL